MTIITGVLADSGSDIRNIIKCSVFLTDMADFAAMKEAYLEFFPNVEDIPVSRNMLGITGQSC